MVKVDATRNYYEDLGVPANADESDIRKAFRQLAFKWHPDRNPGREQEFVAKFQQIQTAHEVLSDPSQRAKYDSERKKYRSLNIPPYNPNTPRTRPPPPPRNAYTTTPSGGSYYRPPPPKPSPRPPPQQHHSAFATGADRFTSKNFRAPPTAQRPDSRHKDAEARANVFTAWQKMKQPRAEEARAYNPNNPNGTPFGRSKSTRVPSSKKGFDPGTPGGDEGQARSSYRSNFDRHDPSPPATEDPLKNFKGRAAADDVPYAEGNRVRTPYFSSAAGERTSMFGDGSGRSASVRNSPTHSHRPSPSGDGGFYSDSGRRPQRNSYGGATKKQPFPNMYESSDEESDDLRSGRRHHRPAPPKESPQQPPAWGPGMFSTPHSQNTTNGTSANPFRSKSEESINMKFSPSDWHGKFEGKADYFAPNLQKGTSNKGRTSPSRGRPAQRTPAERGQFSGQSQPPPPAPAFPFSQPSQMPPPPPLPREGQASFPNGSSSDPHKAKFDRETWAETFKEASWAYPHKANETSPRRGSTSTKKPNAARKPPVASEPSAGNSKADKAKPRYQAFAEDATNGEGDAMDIDSNTPPMETQTGPQLKSRRVTKSPPRPTATGVAPEANKNASAEPPTGADKATAPGLNGLAGLGNVEPFMPSNGGGMGLGDIKDQLPFKSQASNAHPTKPNTAQKLKFPRVPKAPKPPSKLDQAAVDSYLGHMEGYVKQYKAWCQSMTRHFAARDAELEDVDERFLHHRGETTKKLGFTSYLNKMKEDEEVLTTWKVAQELHIKAMEECQEVRNKTMKYSFPG